MTMTIEQIRVKVSAFKPASRRTIIRYLKACNIEHVGARQRPQNYPDTSATEILAHLGLASGTPNGRTGNGRMVSMRELRNARKKASGK